MSEPFHSIVVERDPQNRLRIYRRASDGAVLDCVSVPLAIAKDVSIALDFVASSSTPACDSVRTT